jgi:hypothetical protein
MDMRLLAGLSLLVSALVLGGLIFFPLLRSMLSRCPRCGRWLFARKRVGRVNTYREVIRVTIPRLLFHKMPSRIPRLVRGVDYYECRYCDYRWGEPFELDFRPRQHAQAAEHTEREQDALMIEVTASPPDNHIPLHQDGSQASFGCYLLILLLAFLLVFIVLVVITIRYGIVLKY